MYCVSNVASDMFVGHDIISILCRYSTRVARGQRTESGSLAMKTMEARRRFLFFLVGKLNEKWSFSIETSRRVWSFVGSICWFSVVLWCQLIARTNVLMAPLVRSDEERREVMYVI